MSFVIYFFLICTIIFTVVSVLQNYVMYALFYLALSIVTTSTVFFLLGEYLIGSLQIIIYSGAIIVLFVFVIMMFNIDNKIINKYFSFNNIYIIFTTFLVAIFISALYKVLCNIYFKNIIIFVSNLHILGIILFKPYVLITECISILLLSALIIIILISKNSIISLKYFKDI